MSEYLVNGGTSPAWVLILAHGAGAPMDHAFMTAVAEGLASQNLAVLRFEFDYMRDRRLTGSRRPPERAPKLLARFEDVIGATRARFPDARLAIGGKSMGGRMASMIGAGMTAGNVMPNGEMRPAETGADPAPAEAVICLGYPFHPADKPAQLRTGHLPRLAVPMLICQGERDALGNRAEVEALGLPDQITVHFLGDGDHGLKPRKMSGRTFEQNREETIGHIQVFLASL